MIGRIDRLLICIERHMAIRELIFALLMLMLASTGSAQTISYLGVPLAGNINSFSEKLSLNGIKVNKTISRRLEDGVRAFDVTIFQYPCLGRVEYNTSTKNVYEGILMFQISSTLNEFTQFMESFSNQIEDKYSKGMFTLNYEEDEYNSYPADHYIIYSSKNNKRIGEIYLYMDVKEYDKSTDRGKFLFHVMYRNIEAPSFKERMQDYY